MGSTMVIMLSSGGNLTFQNITPERAIEIIRELNTSKKDLQGFTNVLQGSIRYYVKPEAITAFTIEVL